MTPPRSSRRARHDRARPPSRDRRDQRSYAYRAGAIDQPDNRALRAAHALQTPLIYFRALAPSQYLVIAPMFVTADDPAARVVVLEPGLPIQDMQPGGLVSAPNVRAYQTATPATGCISSASSST